MGACRILLGRLLAQPKSPNGAIGLQPPGIAAAFLPLAGRLRLGLTANRGDYQFRLGKPLSGSTHSFAAISFVSIRSLSPMVIKACCASASKGGSIRGFIRIHSRAFVV
jgi:hypothetical protein